MPSVIIPNVINAEVLSLPIVIMPCVVLLHVVAPSKILNKVFYYVEVRAYSKV